jgi:integrase
MRSFRPLLEKAGLPLIRFHDLRHTVASLLLLAGVHPKVVAELLGHSTINLTLDTYSHVLPSMLESAVEVLDPLLAKHANKLSDTLSN